MVGNNSLVYFDLQKFLDAAKGIQKMTFHVYINK